MRGCLHNVSLSASHNFIRCARKNMRFGHRCFYDCPSGLVTLRFATSGTKGVDFSLSRSLICPPRRIVRDRGKLAFGKVVQGGKLNCAVHVGVIRRNKDIGMTRRQVMMRGTGRTAMFCTISARCTPMCPLCGKRGPRRGAKGMVAGTVAGNCRAIGGARVSSCRALCGQIEFALAKSATSRRLPAGVHIGRLRGKFASSTSLGILKFGLDHCLLVDTSHPNALPSALRNM